MIQSESLDKDESFARAMTRARTYLDAPPPPRRVWPVLAAAGFFAFSSMVFATAAILAPPLTLDPMVRSSSPADAGSFGPPLAGAVN